MRKILVMMPASLLLAGLSGLSFAQPSPTASSMPLPQVSVPAALTQPVSPPPPVQEQAEQMPQVPQEAEVLVGATIPVASSDASAPDSNVPPATMPAMLAPQPFSFEPVDFTVLFTPDQAEKMQQALTVYETSRRNKSSPRVIEEAEPEILLEQAAATPEPSSYPVYTLGSIAYHNARDWTVWLGPMRITPSNNKQEVTVLRVDRNSATFAWKPPYMEQLNQRAQEGRLADTAAVANKLTRPNGAALDESGRIVTFTLRPNQSFVAGYMATFEGRVPSPKLESTTAAGAADESQGGTEPVMTKEGIARLDAGKGLGGDAISRMYERVNNGINRNQQSINDILSQEHGAGSRVTAPGVVVPAETAQPVPPPAGAMPATNP